MFLSKNLMKRKGDSMKIWQLTVSTATIALMAGNAFADVTPEQVWQNWLDMSTTYGQTITTKSAERQGDSLVITGMALSYAKDGAKVESTLDEIIFKDNGDGTVAVTMSDTYPMTMTMPAIDSDPASVPTTMQMTMTQSGMVMTASGTPEATSYAFSAPSLKVAVTTTDTTDASKTLGTGDFNLTQVAGKYLVSGASDAKKIDSDFTAEALAMSFAFADPTSATNFEMTATMADLVAKTAGTFVGMDETDFGKALALGFAANGAISYGATAYDINVTEEAGPTKITGAAESGDLSFALDAAKIHYGGGAKGVTTTLTSAEIPFPQVVLSYSEAAFDLAFPIGKTDAPAEFNLLSKLSDLTISEEIWAMFDPAATLPRDPATLVIDVTGTAKVTANIFDPAYAESQLDAAPGELHSLNVNALQLTVAGADLTGTGAFTFDNTDLETYGGMPKPTGKLALKLVGGNGLMDKLVALGVLPEDQAMSARMMLSMFANPGAGEDELNSELEFKDGGFFANGQQLQ
jgi:hypothetical protein